MILPITGQGTINLTSQLRSEAGRWAAFMSFLNELYGLVIINLVDY